MNNNYLFNPLVNTPVANPSVGVGSNPLQANAVPSPAFTNIGPRFVSPEQTALFATVGAPKQGPFYNSHKNEFNITEELQLVIIHQYIQSKNSLLLQGIIPIVPLRANIIRSSYIDFGAPIAQASAPFSTPTIAGYNKYADITTAESIAFAVNMEVGAMKTAEGSVIFNNLLISLQNSFFNKFESSCVQALYNSQNSASIWRNRGSGLVVGMQLNTMQGLQYEFRSFNACRKDYGLEALVLDIEQSMQGSGIIPDTLLAPYNGILNANLNPTNSIFANSGDGAKRARADAGDNIYIPGSSINKVVGLNNRNGHMNFLNSHAFVGESYAFINPAGDPVDVVRVYNYATNSWHLIKASDAITKCGLFSANGYLPQDPHSDDDSPDDFNGLRYKKNGKWRFATVFGELGSKMLSENYLSDAIRHIKVSMGEARWASVQESFNFIKQENDVARQTFRDATEASKMLNELARQFIYFYEKGYDYVYLNTPEFKKTAFTYDALTFVCEHLDTSLQYDPCNIHIKENANENDTKDFLKKPELQPRSVGFAAQANLYRKVLADFQFFYQAITEWLPHNLLSNSEYDSSYIASTRGKKLGQRVLWNVLFNTGSAVMDVFDLSLHGFDALQVKSLLISSAPAGLKTDLRLAKIPKDGLRARRKGKNAEILAKDIPGFNTYTPTGTDTNADKWKRVQDALSRFSGVTKGEIKIGSTIYKNVTDVTDMDSLVEFVKYLILKQVATESLIAEDIAAFMDTCKLSYNNANMHLDFESDEFITTLVDALRAISEHIIQGDLQGIILPYITQLRAEIAERVRAILIAPLDETQEYVAVAGTAGGAASIRVTDYITTFLPIFFNSLLPDEEIKDIPFRFTDTKSQLFTTPGTPLYKHLPFIDISHHRSVKEQLHSASVSFDFIQGVRDNVVSVDEASNVTHIGEFGALFARCSELADSEDFLHRVKDFYDTLDRATIDDYIRFLIYFQPFHVKTLAGMMHKRTPVPFTFTLLRPVISFDASCVIVMKRGRDTAVLHVGNELFLQSTDANTGQYTLTLRMDIAPTVWRPDAVSVIKTAHIERYLGGGGINFISPEEFQRNIDALSPTSGFIPYFIPYGQSLPDYIPLRGPEHTTITASYSRYTFSLQDIIDQYPLNNTFWSFFDSIYGFSRALSSGDITQDGPNIPMLCVPGAYQYPIGNGRFETQKSNAYISEPDKLLDRSIPKLVA